MVIYFTNSRESWLLIQGYSAVIHAPVHLNSLLFMAYASVYLHGCAYAHTHSTQRWVCNCVQDNRRWIACNDGMWIYRGINIFNVANNLRTKRLWRQGHPNGRCYTYSKDMIMAWQALMGCCNLWESEMPKMIYLIYRYFIHPFFSFIYCFITLGWPEGAAVRKVNRLGIIISLGEHHKSMCGDEQIGKRCTDGLYANKFTVRREGHLERLACVRTQEEEISSFGSTRGVQSTFLRS